MKQTNLWCEHTDKSPGGDKKAEGTEPAETAAMGSKTMLLDQVQQRKDGKISLVCAKAFDQGLLRIVVGPAACLASLDNALSHHLHFDVKEKHALQFTAHSHE
jgi:hypothetical protein